MNKRSIVTLIILMVLALLACESSTSPGPGTPFAYSTFTPPPSSDDNQAAAYAAAQATLTAGQGAMQELAYQATVVSQAMEQSANIAAQATLDDHQRQLLELSLQSTAVSQEMSRAAATQQAITDQNQRAADATAAVQSQAATATAQSQAATAAVQSQAATATAQSQAATAAAQSQAATATYAAILFDITQTAQAQATLDGHATEMAQAQAARAAYALTATPEAAIQANTARLQDESQRQAWWEDFVVNPVKLFLFTLVVLLLSVGGVLAYRRLMPVLEFRLRHPRGNSVMVLTEGTIVDVESSAPPLMPLELRPLNQPRLPGDGTPLIEIVGPAEPAVINWITEAEHQLRITESRQP